MIRACRMGDEGYVAFLKAIYRLGVIDHDQLLIWLQVHGCVLRLNENPLDDGARFDEDALADLAAVLEAKE